MPSLLPQLPMENNPFPWENPWRDEIRLIFSKISTRRSPALRRSRRVDFLFASDLPACAEEDACGAFIAMAGEAGWQVIPDQGWLQIRRADGLLPPGWFPFEPEGEAACLRELLRRHPGTADPSREMILLMKAREEGPAAWERACRQLHLDFARKLREGAPLPRLSFP